jgi:hypothetical protein
MPYSDLNQAELFLEWRIESASGNCILFELGLKDFLDALDSAKKAPQCQLKLTKRHGQPVLCVEVCTNTRQTNKKGAAIGSEEAPG